MKLLDYKFAMLREDEEFILYRGLRRTKTEADPCSILVLAPTKELPASATFERMKHELSVKEELDSSWAVRPLAIGQDRDRTVLVLEDPGGEPLDRSLGLPMEIGVSLRLAASIATALGRLHQHGLVHRDLKPANILVNFAEGQAHLTGCGIASRLPCERQTASPPETLFGTLAYMAPEQTGRLNCPVDFRSDLYSLGVTFYQMFTGSLPFTASDPLEWVHCHIARKPVPPSERLPSVPAPVSRIIMKLLAKAADERYQSAAGVEYDLRRCVAEWEVRGRLDEFRMGQHDAPNRLFIPEKLYGREREIEALLDSYARVVRTGTPELVLVAGHSGIGKSALVNDLQKVVTSSGALYGSGKFDQYKRNIPYSPLINAFQGLVRTLLGKSEAELMIWRSAFQEALGPNGRLLADLIPELTLIIGDQPPVPNLESRQAQSRFRLVFRRFIGVFAQPEHPLALFLDDLQWLDTATLDAIEDLLGQSHLQHFMLVGAFRDNEVDAGHQLLGKLDAIRKAGVLVREIHLSPLTREDLVQLIANALHCECEPAFVAPLADLVGEKTAGNPFFVVQFLHEIVQAGLLRIDHETARWSWDLDLIDARGYTENVVELMVGRLNHLPTQTQDALQQLACLGNGGEVTMLSEVAGMPEAQIHDALWPAVEEELVEHLDGSYNFTHDRVREAAYLSIADASRAKVHLRIGRLMAMQTPPEKREAVIFEIVNQLNRGATLITQLTEQENLAELNLIAGRRAKEAAAFASALTYFITGLELLKEDCWKRRHELIFALELNRADCEFLTGQISVAEERLAALSNRSATPVERARVACMLMDVCTGLLQIGRAVTVCLEYLRQAGIEWHLHPTVEDVRREYDSIWLLLGKRAIEDLHDLPLIEDPTLLATVDVLIKVLPPAMQIDENLATLAICRVVSLSLKYGNCDGSCVAYEWLARIAGRKFGDYKAGFRFGQLGYELVERRGLKRFEASTYHCFAIFVVPWLTHVRACRDLLRRAFEAAIRNGDLMYAAYTCNNLNSDLLFAGEPLPEVQVEAERGLEFAKKAGFGLVIHDIAAQLALIRMLRGLTPKFSCFDDGLVGEARPEDRLLNDRSWAAPACRYWIRKLQARYIAGDYATAVDAALKAQPLLWTISGLFEEAEFHFYSGLSRAAYSEYAPSRERQQHLDAIDAHCNQLKIWAENCPENFENRAALVGAELARIKGNDSEAMSLYEKAIRSARDNVFVNNEGMANELASRFYAARGFEDFARLYLQKARHCYLCWGATGKARQLEEIYPHLRTELPTPGPTTMAEMPFEHLDLATVIKVSQAVSGEMVPEKLIHTLMRLAIEQAGAERGLLMLTRGGEQRMAAEATTGSDTVRVQLSDVPVTATTMPESILHYVQRTRETIILNDAAATPPFAIDPYVRQFHPRSVLCVPLINQTKLVGVLYLENNLTSHGFKPDRIAVLKLLASQAAISIENTGLYRDLEAREARIRLSEHLARGQLEALQETLVSLARESEPGKFLEHVLSIICRQLTAHSISVWEMNDIVGCVDLTADFENGQLRLPGEEDGRATTQLRFETKKHQVWTDFFHAGEHCVYVEIDLKPPGARVSTTPNGPWHDWLGGLQANSNAPKIIERLSAAGIAATLWIPMINSGKVTGMFNIRFKQRREIRQEEIELTRAMTHQAMLALQLMRLSKHSREAAVMSERNRMARDIHDTLAQGFTGIIMQLEAAKGAAERNDSAEIIRRIERAGGLARSSLGEARRSVLALRPRSFRGGTLCMALDDLLKRMSDGTELRAEFQVIGNGQAVPAKLEEPLLRVAQESITNTVKHANARNLKATLTVSSSEVQLQLVDDGRGFDVQAEHDGFGLIGMRERADRLGGRLIIRSKPGEGTEVLVILSNPSVSKPGNGNEQA
jgi:predicted ATPase/signal transduction histidine kinase